MDAIYICFNKTIKITFPDSNVSNLKEMDFWLKRFCPNVKKSKNKKVSYEIICKNSNKFNYLIKNNKIFISGIWEEYSSFLAKFITQVFQKLLIDEEIFIFPAACVYNNNNAILIVGDFGQGKTSTALEFVKMKNFNLLSDNYVAIKNNKIIGATNFISIRKENERAVVKLSEANILRVNNRLFFENKAINKNKLNIIGILNPYINRGDNNFHIISKEESIWYLYQKLTRLISGETVLFYGELPSPAFNNKKNNLKNLGCVYKMLENIKILYVSSSLDNIVNISYNIFLGNGDVNE